MADEKGAKPKVEFKVELEDAGEKNAGQRPSADVPDDGAGSGEPERDGLGCVRDWVRRTFPGHEHAFWGGVLGFVVAILFLVLGLFKALVIVVLVVAGVAVGQALDGDSRIVDLLRRIFSRN